MEGETVSDDLPAIYLGLGSNLGDRRRNLAVALRRLEPLVRVEAVSSLYEAQPVGVEDQPPFYNAACRAVTGLPARGLLRHLHEVEHELGRRPGRRWGPRPIDIDLLFYGAGVIEEAELRVPHPELAKRAFVLAPLAELAPELEHPESGRTIAALLSEVGRDGVKKIEEPGWERA
jgi:2-amino-4-hydroxy-6-hydroxymethyldihydropteridine diphosphokinase